MSTKSQKVYVDFSVCSKCCIQHKYIEVLAQVNVIVLVALTRYFIAESEEEQNQYECMLLSTHTYVLVRFVNAVALVEAVKHAINNRDANISSTTTQIYEYCRNSSKPIASPYTLYNIVCISNRKRYEAFVRCSVFATIQQTKLAFKSNGTVNST